MLSLDEKFEGVLFGLAAQLKEYQLSWHLNRALGVELKRAEDIEIIHKKKSKTSVFSFYRFEDDLNKWNVYVVSNKHSGDFLIPEARHVDYFLMIKGEISMEQEKELTGKLKAMPVIQLVIPMDYNRLKSKDNLIVE